MYIGDFNFFNYSFYPTGSPTENKAVVSVEEVPVDKALVTALQKINKRLLAVRPHIAATVSESGINKETLGLVRHSQSLR